MKYLIILPVCYAATWNGYTYDETLLLENPCSTVTKHRKKCPTGSATEYTYADPNLTPICDYPVCQESISVADVNGCNPDPYGVDPWPCPQAKQLGITGQEDYLPILKPNHNCEDLQMLSTAYIDNELKAVNMKWEGIQTRVFYSGSREMSRDEDVYCEDYTIEKYANYVGGNYYSYDNGWLEYETYEERQDNYDSDGYLLPYDFDDSYRDKTGDGEGVRSPNWDTDYNRYDLGWGPINLKHDWLATECQDKATKWEKVACWARQEAPLGSHRSAMYKDKKYHHGNVFKDITDFSLYGLYNYQACCSLGGGINPDNQKRYENFTEIQEATSSPTVTPITVNIVVEPNDDTLNKNDFCVSTDPPLLEDDIDGPHLAVRCVITSHSGLLNIENAATSFEIDGGNVGVENSFNNVALLHFTTDDVEKKCMSLTGFTNQYDIKVVCWDPYFNHVEGSLVLSPSTASPTTASPTTASPTTASPTTASPTTASPTTESPTTASPTTESPTTGAPTVSPTTDAPTTGAPTPPPTLPPKPIMKTIFPNVQYDPDIHGNNDFSNNMELSIASGLSVFATEINLRVESNDEGNVQVLWNLFPDSTKNEADIVEIIEGDSFKINFVNKLNSFKNTQYIGLSRMDTSIKTSSMLATDDEEEESEFPIVLVAAASGGGVLLLGVGLFFTRGIWLSNSGSEYGIGAFNEETIRLHIPSIILV